MSRMRLTVRGYNIELRGYIDVKSTGELEDLARAVADFGVVYASVVVDEYDPFADVVD